MKKLLIFLSFTVSYFSLSSLALAGEQVNVCPNGSNSNFQKLCNITVSQFIGGIISFFFVLIALVALFYLVWGAFKWLTSGGDKTNIETARGHIIAAIVGLIIAFLSYVILNLVWQFFFGNNLTTINIPTL